MDGDDADPRGGAGAGRHLRLGGQSASGVVQIEVAALVQVPGAVQARALQLIRQQQILLSGGLLNYTKEGGL